MNGSASAPSSATTNDTRCAMSPEMNATSRDSRSSLATMTGHLPARLAASAAASWGRRSRASTPLPGLDLNELRGEHEAFRVGKPGGGSQLNFDAEPRAAWRAVETRY